MFPRLRYGVWEYSTPKLVGSQASARTFIPSQRREGYRVMT